MRHGDTKRILPGLERVPCNLGLWNRTKFRPQPSCRRRDGPDKPLELESETNPCWTYRADCARPSIRALTSSNSHTNAALFLPDTVAASISVPNNMTVARSALHGRQNLSILPGRSKSSVTRPHTLQWPLKACSVISIWNDSALPFPECQVPILQRVESDSPGTQGLPSHRGIVRNDKSESPDRFIRKV